MAVTEYDLSSFGTFLKAFRKRRHLTQQQLASAVGVHRSAIIRWEQGDVLPESKTMVLELARCLRLDDQETRHLLEASLTALAPHWSVPLPRNPFFTGREEILETLHTHLSTGQVVALTQSYALQGLGGIGKTQLALEYAYRYALEYSAVFWIEAETDETAISSLLQFAELLRLPERQETDQMRVVAAVQHWLSSHSGWLLIWDNLEDLNLLSRLLPPVRQGTILITTRCQALGTLAWGMDLAPMEQREGMLFLLRRAKVLEPEATEKHVHQLAEQVPGEHAAARELVTVLGGLPLALDQAGAYIEETGCGLAGYVLRYQQERLHLLNRRGMMPADHPLSVVATLGLACQQVAQQSPAALELLRCCAFLYPDAIPEELLLAGADHVGPVLGPVVASVSQFDGVLATLRTFSLVQRHPETCTLSLHRLVQAVLHDDMSEQEQAVWQQRAVHLLNAAFPDPPMSTTAVETWGLSERLLPHVMACALALPDHRQDQDLAALLLKMAHYLYRRSQDEQAEQFYQRALHLFERCLGPEHPRVGSSLCQLAELYRRQGRYALAEVLFQQALRLLEQALGSEHLEMTFPLIGLARAYREQGKYEQAEPLYQRALHIQEQVLDPGHSDLTIALMNLGLLYREQGKYEQAEALYHRVLQIEEQVLGPEHPDLAATLNNLGDLYREQGKYEQAEPLCLRAVRLCEPALGPDHRDVAFMLETLATLYCEWGKYEQAEPLYQRSLHLFEQVHGPEHILVAYPLNGLAILCREQGKPEQAEALFQRALQIRTQQLGEPHPETAQTLHDLAVLRKIQGNVSEACSLAKRALQIRSQALGDEHPKTVVTRALSTRLVQEQRTLEQEQPHLQTRNVAVRGAAGQVAYTRTMSMREVTFTCVICGQTVTRLHYPSGRIKYCSEECQAIRATQRHAERVIKQREKRRNEREARMRDQEAGV